MEHDEPALLVGETGTGKTTVCQLLAALRGKRLHIVNCNQHTEAADLLGSYRPMRNRAAASAAAMEAAARLVTNPLLAACGVAAPDLGGSTGESLCLQQAWWSHTALHAGLHLTLH
jgi:midasin